MRPYRLALGILIVAMCAVNVLWIRTNVAPPRMYDDAVYLADSVRLLHTLEERGFVRFLRECAEATKGHPPMVKILPVPFYLVFGAGMQSALYADTVLIAIFCVYLFLLAKEWLHSEEIAFFAVLTTVAFPLTYGMWRHVMAEFGTTVAVTACLYHLVRSSGFRDRKQIVIGGLFFGWGLLWKISFPLFIAGPLLYLAVREGRRRVPELFWAGAAALAVAGPFYAIGGRDVIRFARFSAAASSYNELWSLGPVMSPKTVMLYWLSIINFGISPYWFGVLIVLLVFRGGVLRRDASWFLIAWLAPPLIFFSFQVLKEVRHLLPALPAIGIATAVLLLSAVRSLDRHLRVAILALLFAIPACQFVSFSFDTPYAPRADLRLGPFILSIRDLELASLQLIPTYTYPANPLPWPTREMVSVIAAHSTGRMPRVRVVGEHPYLSGLVLVYEAVLNRTPVTSHGPFTQEDVNLSDFAVVVCGPEGQYGPLDRREPQLAAWLADPANGFQEIGRVRLPSQCDALTYRKSIHR